LLEVISSGAAAFGVYASDPQPTRAALADVRALAGSTPRTRSPSGDPPAEAFVHAGSQARMDLRWVYLHVIEEYAPHNGRADLLRERIDGVTGD
jgi:hypothetical protein